MVKEITKLDMDKYLVVKREDLEKYFSQFTKGVFTTETEGKYIDSIPFNLVLEEIQSMRAEEGKKDNSYLVLNLDDEIDFGLLLDKVKKAVYRDHSKEIETERRGEITIDEMIDSFTPIGKVSDIAVALVNAILKAKGD